MKTNKINTDTDSKYFREIYNLTVSESANMFKIMADVMVGAVKAFQANDEIKSAFSVYLFRQLD